MQSKPGSLFGGAAWPVQPVVAVDSNVRSAAAERAGRGQAPGSVPGANARPPALKEGEPVFMQADMPAIVVYDLITADRKDGPFPYPGGPTRQRRASSPVGRRGQECPRSWFGGAGFPVGRLASVSAIAGGPTFLTSR